MWICKNCQNQNEENFKFCWSCGESKVASRKTVRGNTTELTFPKKEKTEKKEIPKVKKIKVESKKEEKGVEKKREPVDVKIKTKEVPEFESEISEVTTQKPPEKPKKEKSKSKKPETKTTSESYEPEIFSSFSPESSKSATTAVKEVKTNWQLEVFTIAVRLLGLYFLYLFIAAIPEIVSFVYASINAGIEPDQFFLLYLLTIVSSLLKYFFYLLVGIYLISSGKILLRLLPEF